MTVAWSADTRVSFFGIERLHPFDIGKMDAIAAYLVEHELLDWADLGSGAPVSDADLSAVHDPDYLASLHRTPVLSEALEVAVPDVFPQAVMERRVLRPFRVSVAGTLVAARGALAHGLGINLGGGFHHARPALGHGFCIYNDVGYAIHRLREDGFSGRVVIVDTDAHQGDGNHAFFAHDATVASISLHQGSAFPHPKLVGDHDVNLPDGTGDATFLEVLERYLSTVVRDLRPDLLVHVAGADVLADDPLTTLGMTVPGLVQRDLQVQAAARRLDVPLLHVLAGGYGPSAATAQSQSVAAMLNAARRG